MEVGSRDCAEGMGRTELELTGPHGLWRVGYESLCEVTLNTTDHVVVCSVAALADDTEGVVLHDRCAADASEEALLHASFELQDGDLG